MFQYHGTLWWDALKGRLHLCVSRKRSLARKLPNVKSWGWPPRGLEALNLRKNVNLWEKGAHNFAHGLAAKAPNSEMGEESVGFEFSPLQCPCPSPPLPPPLCLSPPLWNMVSRIWFSLHLLKACWNLTFTVPFNYLDCYEFIPFLIFEVSGKRKPWYFISLLVIKLLRFIMKKSSKSQEKYKKDRKTP